MSDILSTLLRQLIDSNRLYTQYIDLQYNTVFTLYVPCIKKDCRDILIYYPGGPGVSGLTHIIDRYLPYVVRDGSIVPNSHPYDLSQRYHLIYMDIGGDIGYSINKNADIQHGDTLYSNEMIRCIEILLYHYKISDRPIINMFGFSYAGKIFPIVAMKMSKKGYIIGKLILFSGYTDPIMQEINPINEYLLYNGLISIDEYDKMERITNDIEYRLTTIGNSLELQKVYIDTMNKIWSLTGVDVYNITVGADTESDTDLIMDNPNIRKAIGSNTDFSLFSSLYDPSTYGEFLSSAIDAVKYLYDMDIRIMYIIGSMDGAVLAKGTKDMIYKIIDNRMNEDIWVYEGTNIGKISSYKSISYHIVTGTGHSMDSDYGEKAFSYCMYQ